MSQLSAGAASSDVTPPVGVRLSGFAGRPTGNTGCRDPIRSSVLYFAEGGRQAVILSVDIIGFHPQDDRRLRLEVAERLDMDPDAVMVVCSHTHAGPATMNLRATGDIEQAWLETVIERSAEAAVRARNEAVPVVASHGAGYSFANVNRRLPTGQGVALAPFAGGPCDSLCRVLLLESDEVPSAVLVQYEMHPVMLGNGNLLVSADWVGHLRDKMERSLDCPVVFLQGCCGDVNPRLRGDDGACEALGLDVAGSALTALRRLHPLTEPRLSWAVQDAAVPVSPVPDDRELAAVESAAVERIQKLSDAPGSLSALHVAQAERDWARACRQLTDRPDHMDARVSALSLGDVTFVGLPGEVFTSIGEQIRTAVPRCWTLGYTNGNLGYLYPDDAFEAGGYEVDLAYRLYGERQAAAGTADALVKAAVAAAEAAHANAQSSP